jgi:hypothetical protein
MSARIWQNLGVFVLMVLFSVLFTLINSRERKARIRNNRI